MKRSAAMSLCAIALSGCAPLTMADTDARDYATVEFQNRFVLDRSACFEKGGRIEVAGDAVRIDRNGVPRRKTRYVCVLSRS